jgi:hypothetical protein
MKRIVAISAVIAGLAIPTVANAASAPQLVKPQLVKPQLVKPQLVKPQLVRSQIVSSQGAQALRFSGQIVLLRR